MVGTTKDVGDGVMKIDVLSYRCINCDLHISGRSVLKSKVILCTTVGTYLDPIGKPCVKYSMKKLKFICCNWHSVKRQSGVLEQ